MDDAFETVEQGSGRPLVLLHGLMGDPANWTGLFPYLPETCRVIALRFPFFREDNTRGNLNSIPNIKAYARTYIEQAGLEGAVLCGNSLGGHVAVHLALEMPDRVAGLVLTGSSGLFERGLSGHRGANPPREWVYDKMCEIFHDNAMVTDSMVDDVCEVIGRRRCARDLVAIAKSAKRDNLADRLGEVACPVLLVWGRQDSITPPEVARDFRRGLPDAKLVWLDQCGHAPMMEHPYAFARVVADWWDERICTRASSLTAGRGAW